METYTYKTFEVIESADEEGRTIRHVGYFMSSIDADVIAHGCFGGHVNPVDIVIYGSTADFFKAKNEQLRQNALKKLSGAEIEALGIKE